MSALADHGYAALQGMQESQPMDKIVVPLPARDLRWTVIRSAMQLATLAGTITLILTLAR